MMYTKILAVVILLLVISLAIGCEQVTQLSEAEIQPVGKVDVNISVVDSDGNIVPSTINIYKERK